MAVNTQVLREYLLSLGFKINAKQGKEFVGVIDNVTKFANRATTALVGIGAAAAAMAQLYANKMEQLYFASRRTGSTVKQLQALEFAGEQVGIQGNQMQGAIEGMSRALRANPGLAGMLRSMGVKVEGRTTAQVMLDAVGAFRQMPPSVGQKFAAMFGIDSDTFLTMAQNLDKIREMAALREKMDADAGVDADQNAEAMHEWQNSIREVGAELMTLQGVLAKALIEPMRDARGAIGELIKDWTHLIQKGPGLAEAMKMIWESMTGGAKPGVVLSGQAGPGIMDRINGFLTDAKTKLLMLGHGGGGGRGFVNPAEVVPSDSSTPFAAKTPKDAKSILAALEAKYGLPQGLLDAVWSAESGRGRNMTSKAGAQGHFQFMPTTAAEYGIAGKENDFDASADAAARKYKGLLKRYNGDVGLAAAAYNWGEGNLGMDADTARNRLGSSPAETQGYAAKIGAALNQTNNFNINGQDANDTGKAVGLALDKSNGNALRDLRGVTH